MAFLQKLQQLLEDYPQGKKKELAPKIIEYFGESIKGNRKKQAVERIIDVAIKGRIGTIVKKRILYFLIKNNYSQRETAGFKGKIRDRIFEIFHKENYKKRKGRFPAIHKKQQLLDFVSDNWNSVCQDIDNELSESKDEYDHYDPFNDISYDINIKLDKKHDLEPLFMKSFSYLSTIVISYPYVSSSTTGGLLSYKEFLQTGKKLIPVCTINNHFRNLVFLPSKRYYKYSKYYKFGRFDIKKIKTLILVMEGEIRYLTWNVSFITANNKYINDKSIKHKIFNTFESIIRTSIGNKWHLLCYYFCPFSMELKAVNNISNANLFVVLRLKSGIIDCKIMTNSNPTFKPTPHSMNNATSDPTSDPTINPTIYPTTDPTSDCMIGDLSEYEVSKYFVVAYEIYLLIRENTNIKISDQTWGFFYECFEKEKCRKLKKYFWYKGRDETGQAIFGCLLKTVIYLTRFIKIDKLEVAKRLQQWLDKQSWDLNSCNLDFLKQIGNDYCKLNIGAEGYIYLDLEQNILDEQVVQYGKTINEGIGVVDKKRDKFKHYNGGAYTWKGQFGNSPQEKREFARMNRVANGIRMLYGDELAGIYQAECLNCRELEILTAEDVTNNIIDMGAGNYYHNKASGKSSSLQGHTEHKKFDKVIGISYGEMSYLCIGMGVQGKVCGLTAVPSRSGSITNYEVGKFCMDSIPHCVSEMHLVWKKYQWRLAKLLRRIRSGNVETADKHYKVCEKGRNNKHCGCVGLSNGPFRDPLGKF